jgi:signal peptidase I
LTELRRRRRRRRWIAAGLLVVALVAARFLFIDIRRIPTLSMAPTLLGEEEGGDRVLVDRLSSWARAPRRYEMVAFRHPEDAGRELVKRVVGLPGESIGLLDGDVFVNGQRLKKSIDEILRNRVPLYRSSVRPLSTEFEFDGSHVRLDRGGAALTPGSDEFGEEAALLRWRRAAADGYELDDGTTYAGEHVVFDLGVETTAEFSGLTGSLVLQIGDGGARWIGEIVRKPEGRASARIRRCASSEPLVGVSAHTVSSGAEFPWPVGTTRRVAFWSVDCRVHLLVDGEPACPPVDFDNHRPWSANASGPVLPPRPSLALGVYGGGAFLSRVEVYRDLHYVSKGLHGTRGAYALGPAQFFLLGDRSSVSQDSRDFGGVDVKGILGLVRAVVYPWSRARLLP